MANTSGGWLVYGVSEKKGPDKRPTGHPKAHLGVSDHHGLDSERLRLEDDVRRYITPRLSGFWVQTLRKRKEFPRGPIFVARVPSTWSGPFMVSYQDRTDFKGRGQGGNFAMAYEQIRNEFTLGDTVLQRAELLRSESATTIARLDGSQAWLPLTALWTASLPALRTPQVGGLVAAALASPPPLITPLPPSRVHANLDGVLVRGLRARVQVDLNPATDPVYSSGYVQVYRNGVIRAVDSFAHCELPPDRIMEECGLGWRQGGAKELWAGTLEERLRAALSQYLAFLEGAGASAPYAVMLTMYATKGIQFRPADLSARRPLIEAQQLTVPAFMADHPDDAARVVDDIMDILWQAAEFPGRM